MKRVIFVALLLTLLLPGTVTYAADHITDDEAILVLNEEEVNFPMGWDTRRHDTLWSPQVTFPTSPMSGNQIMTFWNTTGFNYATGVDREFTPLVGQPWTWSGITVNYDNMK